MFNHVQEVRNGFANLHSENSSGAGWALVGSLLFE